VQLCLHSPNMPSWRGAQLKKAQGQLYLDLYFSSISWVLPSFPRFDHRNNIHWSVPITKLHIMLKSRDSSVSIALGYGLNDRGCRVRFPAGAGNFSFHYRVQNGSGAHPASYTMATVSSFPGGKAAGAWSWPLTSI
jgi:hypothetical protein